MNTKIPNVATSGLILAVISIVIAVVALVPDWNNFVGVRGIRAIVFPTTELASVKEIDPDLTITWF